MNTSDLSSINKHNVSKVTHRLVAGKVLIPMHNTGNNYCSELLFRGPAYLIVTINLFLQENVKK